jgi:N-acetylmuramoyl-L-alanine amidase
MLATPAGQPAPCGHVPGPARPGPKTAVITWFNGSGRNALVLDDGIAALTLTRICANRGEACRPLSSPTSIRGMRTDCTAFPALVRSGTVVVAVLIGLGAVFITCDARASAAGSVAGMTVVLDPGHNGVTDSSISRQVPNGRGGTKECNTSGTSTSDGYPEHAFTWDVALHVRDALDQLGVRTTMTRDSDSGVGPCVDQRAALANAARPDAIISIHADGGPQSGSGFHVNYSSPPLGDVQAGPTLALATTMRDALAASGLHESNYVGGQGLYGRADLAGLNLAQYPAVLVELGNMKNASEAAQMESADGRAKYAAAVTAGITNYLSSKAP